MVRMQTVGSVVASLVALAGSVTVAANPAPAAPRVIAMTDLKELGAVTPGLAAKRVVFIGEQHDRYDHHLNQLAIIEAIHARHANLAIGMEMFQRSDQAALDAYIAQQIDESEMLRRTRFDRRWRDGSRLYAPILRFARANAIPLVALNATDEMVEAVRAEGLADLRAELRAQLPSIDRADEGYRRRLERAFAEHPKGKQDFERFMEVQLLWDETMAESATAYLQANPGRRLVVLAGNGHVAYGSGIPQRLARRLPVDHAIILQCDEPGPDPRIADYVVLSEPVALPDAP
jgi:uncharacterized iron-regulated protein